MLTPLGSCHYNREKDRENGLCLGTSEEAEPYINHQQNPDAHKKKLPLLFGFLDLFRGALLLLLLLADRFLLGALLLTLYLLLKPLPSFMPLLLLPCLSVLRQWL